MKIQIPLWEMIEVKGKIYEVRKQEKGLTTGIHPFTDLTGRIKLGTAHLTPIALNPLINTVDYGFIDNRGNLCHLDKITYEFVKKHYIDEGFDFVIYAIGEVVTTGNRFIKETLDTFGPLVERVQTLDDKLRNSVLNYHYSMSVNEVEDLESGKPIMLENGRELLSSNIDDLKDITFMIDTHKDVMRYLKSFIV